jgi:transcriptional regulator with XRE-family HTH domain
MWLDNLKEMKKLSGLSNKQIADKTKLPERTVTRILNGETDHPRVDTLYLIAQAVGANLNDIFADTTAVVATETLLEVKEVAEVVVAERDLVQAENDALKAKNDALTLEIELLKKELLHKEELLALVNYFTKIKPQ